MVGNMKNAIIVDLDGTLCNIEHRRKFLPDWKSFEHPLNVEQDEINWWCREIVDYFEFGHCIIFVSGRKEELRDVTERWLRQHDIFHFDLFMRKTKDSREDSVVKEEIYRKNIEPFYKVLFCVDDRPQVCRMWRSIGLVCLQCNDVEF